MRFVTVLVFAAGFASIAFAQDLNEKLEQVRALVQKNEYAKALDLLQSIPETAPAPQHLSKHIGLAEALMNLGRHAEALPHIEEARPIARRLGDTAGEARVEIAEGNYEIWTRRRGEALTTFQRAVQLALASGNRAVLAEAYVRLAVGYSEVEDWGRWLYYAGKSFELRDAPTIQNQFDYTMNRGVSYFELYDRDAAESEYLRGLGLAMQSGGNRNQSWAHGELAFTYWTFDKDARRALEHYGQAIVLARKADTPDQEATWLLDRGNVYRDTGEFALAISDYQQAIAVEKAKNYRRVTFAATKNIGQCYRLMGRLQDALNILQPLIENRPGNPNPRQLWQGQMELASTYESLGQRDLAETYYSAMLNTLEEQRNSAILDSFRTGSFAHNLSAYDPYERYMRFKVMSEDAKHIAEAFQLSEKARSRSFLEMLAAARSSVAAGVPKAVLDEELTIMGKISSVQQKLRNSDLPKAQRDELLAQLSAFEKNRDGFLLKLRLEHPGLADTRYPDVAAATALQPSINPNETIVSFFLAEPYSFRWTLTRNELRFKPLPGRSKIEAQTQRLRKLMDAPGDVAMVQREAAMLSELLLPGLELKTGGGLVIVPHGVLNYVPFEVLPHEGALLIEGHTVSYAPSINSLAFLRRQQPRAGPFRILAVGAPELPPQAQNAVTRSGDVVDSIALLGPLPYAAEELAAIRRTFGSATETLEGKAARESALRQTDLNAFRVLHFATHGLVSETHPARSGLLFSPEPDEDGLLQMDEIYRLHLQTDLVVLSACQTALGREITGEGIVGLTRAFFYSGTRSVLATLWNLNDRFAAEFIERFYRELAAGRSPEEALRATKLAYIHDARFGHPFYWSSLVLAGDGSHALYTPRSLSRGLVLAGLLLTAIAGAAALRIRRRVVRSNSAGS